ncbi:LysR family transcriptional regulator [Enterobacter sp.]|uniref:LysR family transcriptional regulator n=1 Tax=Enterobacter sp. TaxID=42895 RepID=UPI00296FCA07|nr:LysR family transcriptional regulator [Enterobacter sp.]
MDIFLSKQLKYFMVVMQSKSISKAADKLCITRSPLSKKINELEVLIGGRLFTRKGNELIPTFLAKEYYEKCKLSYEYLQSIDYEISQKNKASGIELLIDFSFSPFLANHIQTVFEMERHPIKIVRTMLSAEDIHGLDYDNKTIAVSLREIPYTRQTASASWASEGFSILYPANYEPEQMKLLPVYTWKDDFTSTTINCIVRLLEEDTHNITFIKHNLELNNLMHIIKSGKGRAILPYKFSQLFKINGIKVQKINTRQTYTYIYHNNLVSSSIINLLKSTINNII